MGEPWESSRIGREWDKWAGGRGKGREGWKTKGGEEMEKEKGKRRESLAKVSAYGARRLAGQCQGPRGDKRRA